MYITRKHTPTNRKTNDSTLPFKKITYPTRDRARESGEKFTCAIVKRKTSFDLLTQWRNFLTLRIYVYSRLRNDPHRIYPWRYKTKKKIPTAYRFHFIIWHLRNPVHDIFQGIPSWSGFSYTRSTWEKNHIQLKKSWWLPFFKDGKLKKKRKKKSVSFNCQPFIAETV